MNQTNNIMSQTLLMYSQLVIPASQGRGYRFQSFKQSETFLQKHYSESKLNEQDKAIQLFLTEHLKIIWKKDGLDYALNKAEAALCFRCRISHEILKAAKLIYKRYGNNPRKPFTFDSILPLILSDDGRPYKLSFLTDKETKKMFFHGIQVLHECLKQGYSVGLAVSMVEQSPVIKSFLLEHGIYPYSDWTILNQTTVKKLEKTLQTFESLPKLEIEKFKQILESYALIYTKEREGKYSPCEPPTYEQLQRMNAYLKQTYQVTFADKTLIKYLKEMAYYLREVILIKHNLEFSWNLLSLDKSTDEFTTGHSHHETIEDPHNPNTIDEVAKAEILEKINHELIFLLDEVIDKKFLETLSNFSSRLTKVANHFKKASRLLLCKRLSQKKVAEAVRLSQTQVTRYIKPKLFSFYQQCRELLKEELIELIMGDSFIDDPDKIDDLDKLITLVEDCLNDKRVFPSDEEFRQYGGSNPENSDNLSLFLQRFEHYLTQQA